MAAIVAIALAGSDWPDVVDLALDVAGAMLALAGIVLLVVAARELGRALTPFPEPRERAALHTNGVDALVRHPIYGGGILFFIGLSLVLGPAALAPTALLGVLWWAKAREEERRLARRFPEYVDYARRTPRRLIPWLL